jgi:hypothetical protein
MSSLTGTNTELIYGSVAAGTAKASFTTEVQINDTSGMGVQAELPANFWLPTASSVGKSVRIVARGILSSTGTPNYTFSVRGGAAGATSGAILLGSAALTTGSTVTNQIWEFDGEFTVKTMGAAGANTTIIGTGTLSSSGTANKIDPLYSGGSSPGSISTFDTSITNFINFNVACSANSASNTITLQQLLVFGLN